MSLIEDPHPDHQPAVTELVNSLDAGPREHRAVLLNLNEEDRLSANDRTAFHSHLIASSAASPIERLTNACDACRCLLPFSGSAVGLTNPTSSTLHCYTRASTLLEFGYVSPGWSEPEEIPRRPHLRRRYGTPEGDGAPRVLFASSCETRDPDDLRDELGLCHFSTPDVVYRVAIDVDGATDLHVPTALDAGTCPAWRRPPDTHTEGWGLTRDLRTDEPKWPEVLVPTSRAAKRADRVGSLTRAPSTDYLARRPL